MNRDSLLRDTYQHSLVFQFHTSVSLYITNLFNSITGVVLSQNSYCKGVTYFSFKIYIMHTPTHIYKRNAPPHLVAYVEALKCILFQNE